LSEADGRRQHLARQQDTFVSRGNDCTAERIFEHQAAAAWHRLTAEHIEPTSIRILQRSRGKALVCRLVGVGISGINVIAKRRDRETAETECVIYGRIMPHLTVSMLRYCGSVVDEDREHYWLFLEDAGDVPKGDEFQFQRSATTKAKREEGNDGRKNRFHADEGRAMTQQSLGYLSIPESRHTRFTGRAREGVMHASTVFVCMAARLQGARPATSC